MEKVERPVAVSFAGPSAQGDFISTCERGEVLWIGGSTRLSSVVKALDMCPYNHVMVVTAPNQAEHAFLYNDRPGRSDFRKTRLTSFFHIQLGRDKWVRQAARVRPREGFAELIAESAEAWASTTLVTFDQEDTRPHGVVNAAATELGFPMQPGTAAWQALFNRLFSQDEDQITALNPSTQVGLKVCDTTSDFIDFPPGWLGAIESPELERRAAGARNEAAEYGLNEFRDRAQFEAEVATWDRELVAHAEVTQLAT